MKKKGISLIVLVITIVVVIILVVAVVLTIINQEQINSAKIATLVTKQDTLEDSIFLYTSKVYTKESVSNPNIDTKSIILGSFDEKYRIVDLEEKIMVKVADESILVYKLDTIKCESVGISFSEEPENSVWYVSEEGKVFLVYEKDDKIEKWIKGNPEANKTVENPTLEMFVAVKNSFSNLKILVNPENDWVKDKVTVEINYTEILSNGYNIYYSIEYEKENNVEVWKKYESALEITDNTIIKAALCESNSAQIYKSDSELLGKTTKEITNIDKIKPTIPTDIKVISKTPNTLEIIAEGGEDLESGLKGYIYKLEDEEEWSETILSDTNITLNIENSANVSACSVDIAGNISDIYTKLISNETKRFDVIYDANGGTGSPTSQVKVDEQDLTLSMDIPTRTGYSFLGWSTSNTATTATYEPGASYTQNSAVTLYAVWIDDIKPTPATAITTNNITTNTISTKASGSTDYGSGLAGYKYSTNNTTWSETTTNYYEFKNLAVNTTYTLYAKAVDNAGNESESRQITRKTLATYTVSYDANGGTGAPVAQTKTEGITLQLSTAIPTRTGYTFLGWSTSNTATSATYGTGANYTQNSSAILYAVWKDICTDATSIKNNPSTCYAKEVSYTGNTYVGNSKWSILLSDGQYVYLMAQNVVSNNEQRVFVKNGITDREAQVAYFNNTTNWTKYVTDKAISAVGGPTIAQYLESINSKFGTNYTFTSPVIEDDSKSLAIYDVPLGTENTMYFNVYNSSTNTYSFRFVTNSGIGSISSNYNSTKISISERLLGNYLYNGFDTQGYKPVVKLKLGTKFRSSNGVLEIY